MHIKAKKSLGQNFLIDREVQEKIVSITDISKYKKNDIDAGLKSYNRIFNKGANKILKSNLI